MRYIAIHADSKTRGINRKSACILAETEGDEHGNSPGFRRANDKRLLKTCTAQGD